MFRVAHGVKVYYERHAGIGDTVVLLHGWGADHTAFGGAYRSLVSHGHDVLSIDFPCFGQSAPAPRDWGVYDFASCVDELITSLGIKSAVLVGHSFGGRICLILSSRPYVKKLLLTGAAGLKPRFSLIKWLKIRWYKLKKKLGIVSPKGGSADFRALDSNTRPVFVRVVNTHLDAVLATIAVPTLIVWGREDKETSMYMAKRFKRGIKDSALIVMEGGHYAYAYLNERFNAILRAFVKE